MEPFITLHYGEYEALSIFSKLFPKKNFTLLVPTSRQQQDVDFVVMKAGTRDAFRVQVKSSRTYLGERSPRVHSRFNNFRSRYRPGLADVYLLLEIYPAYSTSVPVSEAAWRTLALAFMDDEMGALLTSVKTKAGKEDRFFGFKFDPEPRGPPKCIVGNRGAQEGLDYTKHLLEHREADIAMLLESPPRTRGG